MALASNRSLAEQNLDIRPRLETQKELLVARYSKLETFRETYRQHCSQRGGWRARQLFYKLGTVDINLTLGNRRQLLKEKMLVTHTFLNVYLHVDREEL